MGYYSWIEARDYFRCANNEKEKARGDYLSILTLSLVIISFCHIQINKPLLCISQLDVMLFESRVFGPGKWIVFAGTNR